MVRHPSKTIAKRTTRGATRTSGVTDEPVVVDDPIECSVCYYDPNDAAAPCASFVSFPCTHKVCNVCFPKLDVCPICRTGKDGSTGIDRQRREEAAAAAERARRAGDDRTGVTFVFYSGGGGAPNEHPFSDTSTVFRIAVNEARERLRRARSHGQRQQAAAEIMRVSSSRLHIEDLLGRRVMPRR